MSMRLPSFLHFTVLWPRIPIKIDPVTKNQSQFLHPVFSWAGPTSASLTRTVKGVLRSPEDCAEGGETQPLWNKHVDTPVSPSETPCVRGNAGKNERPYIVARFPGCKSSAAVGGSEEASVAGSTHPAFQPAHSLRRTREPRGRGGCCSQPVYQGVQCGWTQDLSLRGH